MIITVALYDSICGKAFNTRGRHSLTTKPCVKKTASTYFPGRAKYSVLKNEKYSLFAKQIRKSKMYWKKLQTANFCTKNV